MNSVWKKINRQAIENTSDTDRANTCNKNRTKENKVNKASGRIQIVK